MTLFCCSGVGGTGKTETIKALLQINPDLVFMPSVVREFMKGLSLTEKDYFQLSRESRHFIQSELLDHYIYSASKFIEVHKEKQIVSDRSVYCHAAYCIYSDDLAGAEKVNSVLTRLMDFEQKYRPYVFLFPYPTTWHNAEDSFRAIGVARYWLQQSLMHQLLIRYCNNWQFIRQSGTIEERAQYFNEVAKDDYDYTLGRVNRIC
jgi:predicted ATPase